MDILQNHTQDSVQNYTVDTVPKNAIDSAQNYTLDNAQTHPLDVAEKSILINARIYQHQSQIPRLPDYNRIHDYQVTTESLISKSELNPRLPDYNRIPDYQVIAESEIIRLHPETKPKITEIS